jgi:hypothetical protein
LSSTYTSNPPSDANHAMAARMSVAPVGAFVCEAMGAACCVFVATVERGRRANGTAVGVVVVAMETGVPTRSGTSGCDAPEAGGGTGRPPLPTVVVEPVDLTVVVVRAVVVVVVDGVVGVTIGEVVVVADEVGVVSSANAPFITAVSPTSAAALRQMERPRCIPQS